MILIFALKDEVEHSLFLKVLRPLCEPGKYSSGYVGHLPWIVKLPKLKTKWGAKDCISLVLLTFLPRHIYCEFLYFASVFITFPVSSKCLTKAPSLLYFYPHNESEREIWMKEYGIIIPSQDPQVHWLFQSLLWE